jgi:uncharacterized protein
MSSYKAATQITAEEIIDILGLEPLAGEGGFFRQTYRSTDFPVSDGLPCLSDRGRLLGTAIYYLLTPDSFSRLHRLPSDEIYHFYLGDPVTLLRLFPDGSSDTVTLGQDIRRGGCLQVVVPKNCWQGSFLNEGGSFGLMGTTMTPGFDPAGYEAGDPGALIETHPDRENLIRQLT